MAKQSGLGDNLYVGGYDLSGDIGSLSRIGGGPQPLEVTGINKSAVERIGGTRDGSINFKSYFNPSANQSHKRLSLLPTTDVIVSYCRGTSLGSPGAALTAKQVNYDGTRDKNGGLSFDVQALANGFGIEWGRQLTAGKRTDVAATNGASLDMTADAADFGGQAYLQVFAFAGTDATVKIQTSQDNGGVDPFSDRIAFTAITAAPTVERAIRGTGTGVVLERYARVITTTVGGFTNLVFSVIYVRNDTAVLF